MKRAIVSAIMPTVMALSGSLPASVYVAESFGYADSAALAGVWGGAGTVTAGLSFSGLQSSGNAVQLNNAAISRPAAGVPLYSAMWSSFLVRQDSAIADSTWGDTNRVGSFYSNADGGNARYQYTPLNARVWGNVNATCGYGAGNADASPALRINPGQTYLTVGYIDHVGMGDWTSLTVSMWVFDETAFAGFLAAGGTQADLDGTAIAKAASTASTWAFAGISAGDLLNLGSAVGAATFDEYRSGTTLADVVVVPEPGALAAGVLVSGVALLRRVRRRG